MRQRSAFFVAKINLRHVAKSAATIILAVFTPVLFWFAVVHISSGSINRIPGPIITINAVWELLVSGRLLEAFLASMQRVVIGFSLATLGGVLFAAAVARSIYVSAAFRPTHIFLRYVPPTAFISLLLYYFGISENFQYAVIFFSVYFFIFQMTLDAIENVDSRLYDLALLSGIDRRKLFYEVIFPAILPQIFDIARINIAGAWTFVVFAEIMGASSGLGRLLATAQRFGNIDTIFALIVTFGFIGLATDLSLRKIKRGICPWIIPTKSDSSK